MRDPERIDEILELLEMYWKKNPDLRLGQIVVNISQSEGYGSEPYYLEDKTISKGLSERLK